MNLFKSVNFGVKLKYTAVWETLKLTFLRTQKKFPFVLRNSALKNRMTSLKIVLKYEARINLSLLKKKLHIPWEIVTKYFCIPNRSYFIQRSNSIPIIIPSD